jgi:hypothetical protein
VEVVCILGEGSSTLCRMLYAELVKAVEGLTVSTVFILEDSKHPSHGVRLAMSLRPLSRTTMSEMVFRNA